MSHDVSAIDLGPVMVAVRACHPPRSIHRWVFGSAYSLAAACLMLTISAILSRFARFYTASNILLLSAVLLDVLVCRIVVRSRLRALQEEQGLGSRKANLPVDGEIGLTIEGDSSVLACCEEAVHSRSVAALPFVTGIRFPLLPLAECLIGCALVLWWRPGAFLLLLAVGVPIPMLWAVANVFQEGGLSVPVGYVVVRPGELTIASISLLSAEPRVRETIKLDGTVATADFHSSKPHVRITSAGSGPARIPLDRLADPFGLVVAIAVAQHGGHGLRGTGAERLVG